MIACTAEAYEAATAALMTAASRDPRIPKTDKVSLQGWAETFQDATDRAQVRPMPRVAEVERAVAQWYASTSERLMPGDVLAIVKRWRTEQRERAHADDVIAGARAERVRVAAGELPAPPIPGHNGGMPAGRDRDGGARNSLALEAIHRACRAYPCAVCGAAAGGDRCRWPDGDATKVPHLPRVQAWTRDGQPTA